MKKEDLNKVIEILEDNSSPNDAYFIFDYDKRVINGNGFIHANKEGLTIYAKELLIASSKFDTNKEEDIYLDCSDWYFWSKKSVKPLIKPIHDIKNNIIKPLTEREKIKERVSFFIYLLSISVIIFFTIIGFYQTINWIFN